jgi:hypothetical protein
MPMVVRSKRTNAQAKPKMFREGEMQ